ncbi:circadian clock KaiB family protein [Lyngbya sp. PCC 8106]|uniref:circadian clock KaiB family protein n=1 Tax=Lyngbya sp. (strain PCC 8106) TaxID=313612 RepID=UPI0000EAD94A|nr:circadian clock KaiB family protein [Lyngbya sp. PCC 8106]EAW34910.1 KaiB [Lyngbya sp. PCC 8106]
MNFAKPTESTNSPLFKGIALFTPGGDLIYCIDPSKRRRWHLHLCGALQEILGLSETPHFLVPCYTATLDQWLDPNTQTVKQSAEAYPPVLRYQTLLNAVFGLDNLVWQPTREPEELCNPLVISTYYQQFPQLWENHDLVVQFQKMDTQLDGNRRKVTSTLRSQSLRFNQSPEINSPQTAGYVLRLFVSGHSLATERTLATLHQLLERSVNHPYTLKVIDVLKHPEQAEADQISATPTLIKVWPEPIRRIVGELNDVEMILRLLGTLED